MDKHKNQSAIETFLSKFKFTSPIAATERIDGVPAENALTAAHFDSSLNAGFTAIAYDDGELHCIVERIDGGKLHCTHWKGKTEQAAEFGEQIAEALNV